MRAVIWLVLLFAAAVVAAVTLGRNDGLVTFYWGGWRLDLSLNLFLLGLVASCFVLVSAIHGIGSLVTLPRRAREWRLLTRERAAQRALRESLAEFFGARYTRAEKAAARALAIQDGTPELSGDHELRVLSHLLAGHSAHRLQDRQRRDAQLRQAIRLGKRPGPVSRIADEAARLLAAEWALDDRDAPRALQMLAELPAGAARRTHALRLKLQAARLARQPQEALRTARLLAKHQGFSRVAAQGLLRSLACEALDQAHDADQLRRIWLGFEAADRRDAFVAARAAHRAARFAAFEDARGWLRPFWDRIGELGADEREQVALGLVDAAPGIGADWLPRLESAATAFNHEPAVLAAVGTVYAERQLWGKARRVLAEAAASPGLQPRARRRAWRRLADLALEEGDTERARQCQHEAASID
ncbi:heme biosynthesis HemY N-terminal domain-containing protein [Aquabacterium sp. J223]|uniref:heme biosynthesis HemY N-terminal domain-containing protein n=1 Tax=Aquabacterium sp. J223 TaxID=2898431 RepID=UPI0021AD5574|nr:heme biosynthesis HemY N-terminal domain-containing protein [Aquabacterium sp. J223]UUX94935.1 heme biosynthesis protein HemY [Aquabacterium sp. J223]